METTYRDNEIHATDLKDNADSWTVLTSLEIDIDVVGPHGVVANDYKFRIRAPVSTGVYIGSKRDEECNYSSLPTSRITALQSATSHFYLVRCKRGDGNSDITIDSYHVSGTPVANSFGSWTVPRALRYENGQVPYRLCNIPRPATPNLNYDEAFSLGAGEWNSVNSGILIGRHQGVCTNDQAKKMISASYISGHPCGNAKALGCVLPQRTISSTSRHYVALRMHIRTDPSSLGYPDWTSKAIRVTRMRPYLPGVISHEFGHASGLGHSASVGDLMHKDNEYTSPPSPPTPNDVDAMNALYR